MTDTITAIATAMSNSGISIVRVSGKDAFSIVNKIFITSNGKKNQLLLFPSHTIHYGFICDGDETIDEVMVVVMKAPRTYTKEDCIEIDCHGGVVVTRKVLETVMKYGARIAAPGEFTKRAFLNGRIDLSRAEAVLDLIHAKNEFAAKNSIRQLNGQISSQVMQLRDTMIKDIAFIEAALDDPEHFEWESFTQTFYEHLQSYEKELCNINKNSQDGKLLTEGIRTVIVGKPNAGKSSLMNQLVGEEKAIVTDIAGTTRDVIEETIYLDGFYLRIMDTAGIRETDNLVESIGVERSLLAMKDADLILYVVDQSIGMDENDKKIMESIDPAKTILICNKSDLKFSLSEDDRKQIDRYSVVTFSAITGEGMQELKKCIQKLLFDGKVDFNDEVILTNYRQKEMIQDALHSIQNVKDAVEQQMPEDFYTIDMMNAYDSLGMLVGEKTTDDLIDTIFRDFCMGK